MTSLPKIRPEMDEDRGLIARGSITGIRRFSRRDVDQWCRWPKHQDPLFQDYNPPDMDERERDLWYAERLARPDHAMFAIVDEEGELIGRLFLRQVNPDARSAVLGIDLRSDVLNRGYGTDALGAFLEYYFDEMGYDTLYLDVAAYNRRAQRVYEKLGWRYTREHWNTYRAGFLPDVFGDPRFEPVRRYFRAGLGTISVLHYDMVLTRQRWLEGRQRES